MTKRWIHLIFIISIIHSLFFFLFLYFGYQKIWLLITFLSLMIWVTIMSFKMYSRLTSPYALATMFVEGLKLEKFNPPISHIQEPDASELMNSLNQLAQDLKTKQEMIKKLENLRIEFVANVSHELKTPLTSIRGYTETLISGAYKDPEACQKFLKRIDENSERLNHLISDLLELSKLETFPDEIERSVFPAQILIEHLENAFYPRKVAFKFTDQQIEGDRKKLEQVFVNLIDNAIRYSPQGTTIEVMQTRDSKNFIFEVKDHGPGIAKEHLPRIFERFYRVDKARSSETGGTGLGLAIVKHIVLAHGGSIEVESELGKGTQFLIRIPKR
jgi:signal transduction histidine kinase